MTDPLTLNALLTALREVGIRVGISEVERLHRVFALQPGLPAGDNEHTRRRLKAVLRAVLVKNAEDRAAFERVCDGWLARAEREMEILTAPAPREREPVPKPGGKTEITPTWKHPRWWYAAAAILLLGAAAAGVYLFNHSPETIVIPIEKQLITKELRPDKSKPIPPSVIRNSRFKSTVPILKVIPAESIWTGWIPLGLGILALATAGCLWITLGRRRWLPEPAPAPTRPGPPRMFLQPPPLAGPQLLDTRQQEALVWGIGRFMADEPTRRLDIPATVKATARTGGVAELHFQRAYYQREVWLWLDEATEDATIARLADEVEITLKVHSLAVERAVFRGIPERLVTATGAVFAPREIDERRDVARWSRC